MHEYPKACFKFSKAAALAFGQLFDTASLQCNDVQILQQYKRYNCILLDPPIQFGQQSLYYTRTSSLLPFIVVDFLLLKNFSAPSEYISGIICHVNCLASVYDKFNPLTRIKLENPKTWIPHVI